MSEAHEFGLPQSTIDIIRRILAEVPEVEKAVVYDEIVIFKSK
ncbi:hypothetical protein [Tepidiphilus sp. J10]|jgi:hypothetical protein|nr:hypothetical protein [Tepidiphilus sp. J10]